MESIRIQKLTHWHLAGVSKSAFAFNSHLCDEIHYEYERFIANMNFMIDDIKSYDSMFACAKEAHLNDDFLCR